MKRGAKVLDFFKKKPMRLKFTVVFIVVITVPMALLAYVSYRVIDGRLSEEARARVGLGLKTAWVEYGIRGEQMRYGMVQAASSEYVKAAVASRDGRYLKKNMAGWKQVRPYVDIWAVTDENGRVITRLNSSVTGDTLDINGFVGAVIASSEPGVATEVIPAESIEREGAIFREKVLGLAPEKWAKEDVMAVVVVTPVADRLGVVRGSIVTIDVLNNDRQVPDALAGKIPGLYTSISVNGARIATNLADPLGRGLRLSKLPPGVEKSIGTGEAVTGEWTESGTEYLSAFEAIRNHNGEIIGSIDVGIHKASLWVIQRENQIVILVIALLGIGGSIVAAIVSTYMITRPVREMKDKLDAFGAGDTRVRMEVEDGETGDEIMTLARAFNSMMHDIGRRSEERERHFQEIGQKNRELAEVNKEIKRTNEEIELAYEETQSQTEELHAINEELKLLNEDLDRKNDELRRANARITNEEREVKRAKDKLRLIYDSIRDYVLLVGPDSRVTEANRFFLDQFGLDEGKAAGRSIYELFKLDVDVASSPVGAALDAMHPVATEMITNDGKVLTWQVYPLIDPVDGGRKAVVYIRDVTEQRLMSQKLAQNDKLSSLGELVSGVAHELNNPLTGIMCFSELLMDDGLRPEMNSKLKKINEASHRCKKIIDNLLTFARWKRPEKTYQDINKVITDSVEMRMYQLNVDNVDLELDLDASVPPIMLDDNQLHQVFLNLINNASDAIKETGDRGKIRISSRHVWNKIVVKVEDSGKGIPEDVANRIFDPFFTTKGVGKGTGLGLSISYGIINEHGGNIYASSKLGRGTVFVVELPVTGKTSEDEPQAAAAFDRPSALLSAAAGKRALILDDEPIVLELIHDALASLGLAVDTAASGDIALGALQENDYDIIISDIKMPGLDGKGFYREVRRLKPEAVGRIIFISGDSVNKETQEFLESTGNLSLRKPFSVDELKAAVSTLIS